jgi:hypothetical protein
VDVDIELDTEPREVTMCVRSLRSGRRRSSRPIFAICDDRLCRTSGVGVMLFDKPHQLVRFIDDAGGCFDCSDNLMSVVDDSMFL